MQFGIGPDRAGSIDDPIAGLEPLDAFADRLDRAGRFQPQARRQFHGVEPAAVIGVDEVQPDRGMAS